MENKTSDMIKGRKKLRYFTHDEGTAVPKIKEVFTIRDIDEFFDGVSQTKLDSGFLSPLPKSTPGAGAEEEDAPQEAERVALPAEDKTIGENGLTDKESSFKDSVPLKTSSPIAVAPSIYEAGGDGDEEKPLGSPLLLADDNEDPIEGNMDHKEDLVRESSFIESSLTPPKRFTLGVRTQQRDKSPVFTVLARKNHECPEQKNVSVASESHTLAGAQMDGEQETSVSTQTAQSAVEAIKESDSSLKSSSTTDEQSFLKKLREFMTPKATERSRLPVPVRAPSPQELDDDDDFLFLEDDAPLLFSLKRKPQTQRQTSKKAVTETRTTTEDGASSENELGTGGNTAGAALTSEPPPKGPATHKKRGKQGKLTDAGEGVSAEAHEVGGSTDGVAPAEPPPAAPSTQKKRGKQGKQTEKGASGDPPEVGRDPAEAAPPEPPLKAPAAQRKRGKQKERAATESLTAEKPDGRMGSTGLERSPVTPGSKPLAPAPADNAGNYGDGPVSQSPVAMPQHIGKSVQQKARQKGPSKDKPFLSKNKKKKINHRRSSVTSLPDRELKSNVQMSKAASITARPESTGQAADAAPSQASPKAKSIQKEKESKRAKLVQPEESEERGACPAQPDSPQRGGDSDATGETEAVQLELSLELSGSSALGKRKRSKPGSWWALSPDKDHDNDALASSPLKRQKKSKWEDGKQQKKMGKEVESREENSSDDIRCYVNLARLPQQQTDIKGVPKSRQKKVKGDRRPNQRKPQTDKDRRRRPQEEAASAPPNQLEEEEEEEERMAMAAAEADSEQTGSGVQVNMSSEAPTEPAKTSPDDEVVSRPDVPRPRGRTRRPPSNWWDGLQPQPAEDIIPSPSPPRSFPDKDHDNDALASSPLKRQKKRKREAGKQPKKMGKEMESCEENSSDVIEEGRNQAGLPQQQTDKKGVPKSRQKKVKGDRRPNQRKPQTDKDRRRRPQEEAASAPPNQLEEEEEEEEEEERMAVVAAKAPTEPAKTSRDDEVVSRPDVPRPRGRTRRPPSNWWDGLPLQPQPAEDIIPSPSPPRSFPEPRQRVATPGRPVGVLHQRAGKLAIGSQNPSNHLKKNPERRKAATPKTRKGSLAAFGAIYTSGRPGVRNTAARKVRKNLLNSLEDSSSRSMDGSSYDRLNRDDVNQEACDRVSNSVVLEAVVQLKSGDLVPASDWPSQNHSNPGLNSGPSSLVELRSFEEEEDQMLPSTVRVPMALSEGDICGPLLRPLTLVPDDWQNLTYWLRQVWRTSVKYAGQVVTADNFHWYTHEGRALGHKFDLQCSTYANGKLLLGSYMRKPAQVDQHTTTVFNVYTSSVHVQIKDLKSNYNPGQAFVVPRGKSYSIRNLTPVPAILWYHRMFADLEDS